MKDFLITNWFILLIAAVFMAFDIYLAVTKQWGKLREQAYALMLQAERIFSSDEGKKKFDAVFDQLYYNLIPAWMRLFISPDTVKEKLQEWYDLAKDYLDNGKIDNSTE